VDPRLLLGHVMHTRLRPAKNAFVYPVFFVQLPLRRLDQVAGPLFGIDRWRPLSLYQRDHGPRDGSPLLPWILGLLRQHGLPDDGEVMLQTFPRVMGYVFNPVSFWYCHDRLGRLVAVLAEVNNTFGGHHDYLLHRDGEAIDADRQLVAEKRFHVSPFCQVAGTYGFRFRLGRGVASARIDYGDDAGPLLLTAISGRPHPWSTAALLSALLRMPLLTVGIITRIHWQALKLWLKGVPFHGARPAESLQETIQ
jgi:hypothetical protein